MNLSGFEGMGFTSPFYSENSIVEIVLEGFNRGKGCNKHLDDIFKNKSPLKDIYTEANFHIFIFIQLINYTIFKKLP